MGGLMDFLSPALTTASQVAGADAEGKKEGNALLRAIHQQQIAEDEKRAMSQKAIADAALANSRIPGLTDPTKVITAPGQPVSVVHTRTGTATPVTTPGQAPDADGNGEQQGTPLITPPRPTKIDPLSPQGIAARKQLQPPAKPRNIDPLSPEGIAARLQLKPATADGAKPLPAPLGARVSQAGEMIKKAADLMPMIDGLPATVGNSAAADLAEHGIGIAGHALPGSKGVGNMMLNNDSDYSQYNAALEPFVLSAAHAIGGARITEVQRDAIRRSVRIEPGDVRNPKVIAQKKKNMIDLVNSTVSALPGDAMAAQERQMDPEALSAFKKAGYRGVGGTVASQQSHSTPGAIVAGGRVQPQQGPAPTGDVNLGAPASLHERVQQLKAMGLSKDAAKAQLIHEGLLPPGGEE